MNKKEQLIKQIKEFDNKYFNEDQKLIAIDIIKNSPEEQVQQYADFIFYKRRTGFAFDYSPEIAKGRLITLKEDVKRRINVKEEIKEDENKLIIGDNYNALKTLLITHKEKIDIIYIDPPYNTEAAKNDGNESSKEGKASKFIYKDKFGRNGWLNMMKDRLTLARDLLSPEGVIFVSIDDSEQAYLKVLMDDIFGEENFVSNVFIESNPSGRSDSKDIANSGDYLLIYSLNKEISNFNKIILDPKDSEKKGYSIQKVGSNSRREDRPNLYYPIYIKFESQKISLEKFSDSIEIFPKLSNNEDGRWIYSKDSLNKMINNDLIEIIKNSKKYIIKWKDKEKNKGIDIKLKSSWHTNGKYSLSNSVAKRQLLNIINNREVELMTPKNIDLIKLILLFSSNKNSIILDFFVGSGTTGHAVMELNKEDGGNRKFILVTNNENNIAHKITYERLHRIIKGEGTNGEKDFKWLEKNKPYLNEKLRVINIDDSLKISLDQKFDEKITKDAKNGLKLLDGKYSKKEINLYYDLAALNPLEKDEKENIDDSN